MQLNCPWVKVFESAGLLLVLVFINYSAGAFCLCWVVFELGAVWMLQTANGHTGWRDVFLMHSVLKFLKLIAC